MEGNARLTEEAEYRALKTTYSVRFFPELKGGEKRPDQLKDRQGVVEGWGEVMSLELAFYLAMTSRITAGILKGSGRTGGVEAFFSAKTIAEVRAIASCLWIEKQQGFPFRSMKKGWKADDVLALSADLERPNKRHAAIVAQPDRLKARGIHISGEQCGINCGKLEAASLNNLPIPGLVDQVSIPLGILARLDGHELQTPEDVINWLSSFLRMPRITHEFLINLNDRLSPLGVSLTLTRFKIAQDTLNLAEIRRIKLPDIIPGCELTFGDIAMMNGCTLEDEDSLRGLLDIHCYNPSTRIPRQNVRQRIRDAISGAIEVKDGDEDRREEKNNAGSFDHYRRGLESMRISPVREAEIIERLKGGEPFNSFMNEIMVGYQAIMLNWILRFGGGVHYGREENIKDILGEANLNFVRRADNFTIKAGNPIRRFVFSCLFSAMQEGVRTGLFTGIKMTGPADRVVLKHHGLVLEAIKSPYPIVKGGKDLITINLPPTTKHPQGRTVTFKRGDLIAGLYKLQMIQSFGQSANLEVSPERDMVNVSTPYGFDSGPRERTREGLLMRFEEMLTRGFNERQTAVLVNEMRLQLGLSDSIPRVQLANDMGVTQSRVSQLIHEGRTGQRMDELFGPGLREHFTDEEIMILLGQDQEMEVEDYL